MGKAIASRRYDSTPHDGRHVVVSRQGSNIIAEIFMWDIKLNEKKFSSYKRADEYLTHYGWKEVKHG